MKRPLCWLIVLAALSLMAGCATRRAYEAALVLADIAAGDQPSRLKRKTPTPTRTAVDFPVGDQMYAGDLYESPEGPRAAIVLVPGATEEGKDDPRLTALANTLARARFTVLVPDLPSVRQLKINSGNVQEVRAAFAWLRAQRELVPDGRAGFAGISYAAAPALLAAMEPDISDDVRFILTIGGYYDLVNVLTFFTTGYYREDGEWVYCEPNEYGKWVFVLSVSDRISDPEDRAILETMARLKISDPNADLDPLAEGLGSEGCRVFEFLTNQDPERTPELLNRMPAGVLADVEALDIAGRALPDLKARLVLVHGIDDDIIPYTESVSFAGALPEDQARLFVVGGLLHVDLEPSLKDKLGLLRAISALLGERGSP